MVRRILLGTLAVAALGAATVRLIPMDAEAWHADPTRAERTGRPNDWLVADDGDRPALVVSGAPADALARLDAVAMAEPGVTRLAGTPADGFVTYVQRSRVLGFPDAISVRAVPDGAGSRLAIWSRSRFGRSDLGVNRARVERWLAAAGL